MNKYVIWGILSVLFVGILFSSGCVETITEGYHWTSNKLYSGTQSVINAPETAKKEFEEVSSGGGEEARGDINHGCGLDEYCISSAVGANCWKNAKETKVMCEEETSGKIYLYCCGSEKCSLSKTIEKKGLDQVQIDKERNRVSC